MIVEREEEIERFEPREYWTLEADTAKTGQPFMARLTEYGGEKLNQFSAVSYTHLKPAHEGYTLRDGGDFLHSRPFLPEDEQGL